MALGQVAGVVSPNYKPKPKPAAPVAPAYTPPPTRVSSGTRPAAPPTSSMASNMPTSMPALDGIMQATKAQDLTPDVNMGGDPVMQSMAALGNELTGVPMVNTGPGQLRPNLGMRRPLNEGGSLAGIQRAY